ncbi:hypothetical protein [Aquimarina sp. MMG016]|uniref:hypothetical protein n=1 Tax=Aquimarina sp. MMG016 TaxID=2822690 RepID=UPI001B3A757F|nr:hypothetical protein [Aquimarina sp. MMG016]MBQ4820587.1 hypothetical protein [Aquimarina sp. MMG016]
MKTINIILLLCILCWSWEIEGQSSSYSETIHDVVVASHKGIIAASLGTEISLLQTKRAWLDRLERVQRDISDRRGALGNFRSAPVLATLEFVLLDLNRQITLVDRKIQIQKFATLGLKHGLYKHESNLRREREYLNKLNQQNIMIKTGLINAGGAGYNYTAAMKLLKRAIDIRAKVFDIDKDVSNLITAGALLFTR